MEDCMDATITRHYGYFNVGLTDTTTSESDMAFIS
tara:strand:- start:394 stop:498 length:105 start_codon:yes stop_codon:yes gene_type:complete